MQESHDPNLFLTSLPVAGVEHPIYRPGVARPSRTAPKVWRKIHLGKILFFTISLFLFILAITLMKEGARAFAPLVRNLLDVSSAANALGFGWLFAYVIMSGSPIAAAALTFFDACTEGGLEPLVAQAPIAARIADEVDFERRPGRPARHLGQRRNQRRVCGLIRQ